MNPTIVSFMFPKKPLNEIGECICEGAAVGLSVVGAGSGMRLGRPLGTTVGEFEYTTVGDRDGVLVVELTGFPSAICWFSAKGPTIKCDTKFS